MSLDGPSLVVALLLNCMRGGVGPHELGMGLSTAPGDLSVLKGSSVYRATVGEATIYRYVTEADPGHGVDNSCSIAAYGGDSSVYLKKRLKVLESARWSYKITFRRKPADDGLTEVPDHFDRGLLDRADIRQSASGREGRR